MKSPVNKSLLPSEIFDKAAKYCSAEERCKSQVIAKLQQWDVHPGIYDNIIEELENSGFLNENRYAELFVRSKVRQNSWGRYKIVQAMKMAKINEESIQYGLSQLDDESYMATLRKVLTKAQITVHDNNSAVRKQKMIRHALAKGFETDLILSIIQEIENNSKK